ncbi:MAG: alanyl-tRNA editing protein [Sedimenticola sp.]
MTELLFNQDAYMKGAEAGVVAVNEKGIRLDGTIFYPLGGGQPGDRGQLVTADGVVTPITDTRRDRESGEVYHIPEEGAIALNPGDRVTMSIDWSLRHRRMRMHTCLHLLCSIVDGGVTGGSVSEVKGRLDFDLPEQTLDKEHLTRELNRLIEEDHPLSTRWISDEEMAAHPDMVRTMSVKPPSGQGRVRLVDIEGVDLQPCGGTHVASTGEIGAVRVAKIEKKGRANRRVNIVFEDG